MNRLFRTLVLASLALSFTYTFAQETASTKYHSISFKPQFFQLKDEFNYGLVFSGLNLGGAYSFIKISGNRTFTYTPELAFGANFKKGVGLAWKFQPIDIFYGYKIKAIENGPIAIGPYFAANYQWQLYPFLQSGHVFWFTSIEVGPQVILTLPYKNKQFKITLAISMYGWTSRPEPATEIYYYSLNLSDFVSDAHNDLRFGSYNMFNHTNLEIELLNNKEKRLSFAYGFEYFGYYKKPGLDYISHSLNLKWKIGKQ